ncbi:MAG: FxsA family protein [Candidatus Scalindua rubra]|uniref:Phage T7 F exclusion suppressor FxsA n=1 Tax=Candidatus Scalindua brodae TaxID=237368 RepID=A0A0B0EI84_9BACT|nr:MAG: phage T7 F exclusion suppressor FxsA [Candidatus Scalindua brodae]MBZ0108381.1 FxsA family protein [Candidatus Scalindua rubra]TWU34079.1 phage T7 F exclusion suppressor FxsA [Candidatus Brocadiaceae bacterium S225]
MLIRLILLFTVIPLIELYLLIQVGRYLGSFQTIMIVLITGIIGSLLARSQGLSVQRQIREDLQNGIIPTDSLIDGCFILIAGALLITPGMITDIFGFVLMVPFFRGWLKKRLKEILKRKFESGKFQYYSNIQSTNWKEEEDSF